MAIDTQQILEGATKLGQLVNQHAAVAKYREAQKSLTNDPDAQRLMKEFDRQIEALARQEASGMPLTDAQRTGLESLQAQIGSHLKIKALHLAQVDFYDLLRKVNQTIQRQLNDAQPAPAQPAASAGPRLVV